MKSHNSNIEAYKDGSKVASIQSINYITERGMHPSGNLVFCSFSYPFLEGKTLPQFDIVIREEDRTITLLGVTVTDFHKDEIAFNFTADSVKE